MSVAATAGPQRRRRFLGVAPLVAATLVAGAAGAVLGSVVAADRSEPTAAKPEPRVGLRSDFVRLPLPAGWEPLGRRSSLTGFEQATAVRAAQGEVALDIRTPDDPSLLPAGIAATRDLPAPRLRELSGRTVWRYDLPAAGLVALALPTTDGVLTIACAGPAGADCEQAARTVRLAGASALVPAPETAAAIVLPDAVARLNRHRTAERRRLAATRSPERRSQAARRLAGAYAATAVRLRPVAAGAAARVTATLSALARSHRALGTASGTRRAGAARRAGARIARQERRLGAQLAAMARG
jgi:hypothetical protein